jgi:hypothetical protein
MEPEGLPAFIGIIIGAAVLGAIVVAGLVLVAVFLLL